MNVLVLKLYDSGGRLRVHAAAIASYGPIPAGGNIVRTGTRLVLMTGATEEMLSNVQDVVETPEEIDALLTHAGARLVRIKADGKVSERGDR